MHARPHLLLIPVAALTMLAACGARPRRRPRLRRWDEPIARSLQPDSDEVYLDIAVGLCQPEPDVEEIGEQVDDLIAPVLAEFDMDTLFASSGD